MQNVTASRPGSPARVFSPVSPGAAKRYHLVPRNKPFDAAEEIQEQGGRPSLKSLPSSYFFLKLQRRGRSRPKLLLVFQGAIADVDRTPGVVM